MECAANVELRGAVAVARQEARPRKRKEEAPERAKRWSATSERLFLDTLAATCNVMVAIERSGFSATTLYYQRRQDGDFAQRWQDALQLGYERLEAQLLEVAGRTLLADPATPEGQPKMTIAEALRLLELRRRTAKEGDARSGRRGVQTPDLDDLRSGILRKLTAIERARDRT